MAPPQETNPPPSPTNNSPPTFLTRAAFLLTPSHDLTLDRAFAILDKLTLHGDYTVTKTSTGLLFSFSEPDDFQTVYRRGFHRATGGRLYRKIIIPCRPQRVFTLLALEIPNDLPEDDIRAALYKFSSVIDVTRLPACLGGGSGAGNGSSSSTASALMGSNAVRISLASLDEYNALLKHGLEFYGATYFPTEAWSAPGNSANREPGLDTSAFSKMPTPLYRTMRVSKT